MQRSPDRAPFPLPLLLLALVLAAPLACSPADTDTEAAPPPDPSETQAREDLQAAAREVATALRDRDFEVLAERASEAGVTFSPYAHVDPESDVTLTRGELRGMGKGSDEPRTRVRTWGTQDGSGEPIELAVDPYFERYVYDVRYLEEATVSEDARQGKGNTIDNAAEVYPEARIVEFHVPGRNPDYGGLDWRSLRLVMEEGEEGKWNLRAVIHDEWTI